MGPDDITPQSWQTREAEKTSLQKENTLPYISPLQQAPRQPVVGGLRLQNTTGLAQKVGGHSFLKAMVFLETCRLQASVLKHKQLAALLLLDAMAPAAWRVSKWT